MDYTYFFVLIAIIAFLCEYVDSSLGMGYGTTLTPLLLFLNFEPLQIVPAVLLSEFITGISAGLAHNKLGNCEFKKNSEDTKVTTVLASCSVVGTIIAVVLALTLSKFLVSMYIGILVLLMGILIVSKSVWTFSWKKIVGIGVLAAFNKGISGGGYGPLVAGGQIISGRESKNSIGSTSLAEGIVCLVGILLYLLAASIDFFIALPLAIGAVLSVPIASLTVKKVDSGRLKRVIGIVVIILGVFTLIKVFL
ncbi:MAG: sulfite exporter TauE/SafE family protein [Promethearchaeota archaeon]